MALVENVLKPVLKKIAEEQEYKDYRTDVSVILSGGANYTSQLYAITLSALGKDDIKLFAKVAAMTEEVRSQIKLQVFDTETLFYTKLLPQYRKYEEKYKFPMQDRLILSKFYGASNEYMKEVLVLEDLTAKGYQPFDRFKCFDWEYASKCVSYLARLHALSVRYARDYPEEFEDMSQELADRLYQDQIKYFMRKSAASGLEGVAEEYKERVTEFVNRHMTDEKFKIYFDWPRKCILSHGDFRPSNIMHKTKDDGQVEIVALDYQVLHKGTPTEDLIYLLVTGSDEEFLEKHFDQYFDHYYDEFNRMLRKLKINPYDVYTRNQFDEDVRQFLPFGIILGLVFLPVITVDEEAAPKLEDGIDLDKLSMKPNELFQQRFGALFKHYVKMGIL